MSNYRIRIDTDLLEHISDARAAATKANNRADVYRDDLAVAQREITSLRELVNKRDDDIAALNKALEDVNLAFADLLTAAIIAGADLEMANASLRARLDRAKSALEG